MGIKKFMSLLGYHISKQSKKLSEVGDLCGTLPEVGEGKETVLGIDLSIFIYTMFRNNSFIRDMCSNIEKNLSDEEVVNLLTRHILLVPSISVLVRAAEASPSLKLHFVIDGERPNYK